MFILKGEVSPETFGILINVLCIDVIQETINKLFENK